MIIYFAYLGNAVWPDLAKFKRFGEILIHFGNLMSAYFALGKILNQLWQILGKVSLLLMAKIENKI